MECSMYLARYIYIYIVTKIDCLAAQALYTGYMSTCNGFCTTHCCLFYYLVLTTNVEHHCDTFIYYSVHACMHNPCGDFRLT